MSGHVKRFFIEYPEILKHKRIGYEFTLEGKEFNHLKASRVKLGERIELFGKDGSFIHAKIASIQKKSYFLTLEGEGKTTDTSQLQKTLAVGMPKGPRSDWLVEKATELGVHQIIPLETERLVGSLKDSRMERWNRLIIQATKQSFCKTVPILRDPMTVSDLIEVEMENHDVCLWGCMPYETAFHPQPIFRVPIAHVPKKMLLVIGPEGDLSNEEKSIVQKKGIPVILSKNTLRVETAAIAMLTAVDMRWDIEFDS